MSDDDDLGGLENLTKGRDQFALCRAIQESSLRLAVLLAEAAGLMPAPCPPKQLALFRAVEVRTEGQFLALSLHPSVLALAY